MMVGAAVPAPVVTGGPSEAGRGASVTGDGATVAATSDAGRPAAGDPPPSAFAAVLAGLMLAPVVPPPAAPIGREFALEPAAPDAVEVSDLRLETPVTPGHAGIRSTPAQAEPVRSVVAEAVLAALMAFRPGHVDGQTVATAARTSMTNPTPVPGSADAGAAIEDLVVTSPIATPPTDGSDPGEADGRPVADDVVAADTGPTAESVVVEPRLPPRRGLETVAAVVRQAMSPELQAARASTTPPSMMADPTAVAGAVAVSAGAMAPPGQGRRTGSAADAHHPAPDDGSAEGDAPSPRGATPSSLFAFGGSAPHAPGARATVSAPAGPPPVADVAPPPPTGAPSQATVDLALGDGVSGRLRIAVRGEVIHATILADAAHAALLQNELPALRRALREHGFQEAHLTVRVPPATGPEVPTPRREAAHPDPGGRDARPDQRPFTDDDRPRDRRRHPTEEEFS